MGSRKGQSELIRLTLACRHRPASLDQIGAILVCINPASSLHELRSALNLTGCDLLFISRTIKNRDLVALLHDMLPSLRSTSCTDSMKDEQCPALKKVFMVDNTDLGAKGFADLLDRDGLAGRDSRNVLDWSRNGVPDAPACTASDGKLRLRVVARQTLTNRSPQSSTFSLRLARPVCQRREPETSS